MSRFTLPFGEEVEGFEVLVEQNETGIRTRALRHGQSASPCVYSCDWATAEGLAYYTGVNAVEYIINRAREDVTGLDLERFPV